MAGLCGHRRHCAQPSTSCGEAWEQVDLEKGAEPKLQNLERICSGKSLQKSSRPVPTISQMGDNLLPQHLQRWMSLHVVIHWQSHLVNLPQPSSTSQRPRQPNPFPRAQAKSLTNSRGSMDLPAWASHNAG